MRTTGNGFFFIAPVRVRVAVISYTCRLLIFKSVASSCTVKISIALTLATPRTPVRDDAAISIVKALHGASESTTAVLGESKSARGRQWLNNLTHSWHLVQ